jgi:hypothetical protein
MMVTDDDDISIVGCLLVSPVATASAASLSQPQPISALDLETTFRSVHEALFVVDLWLKRVAIEVFGKVSQF